MGRYKTSGGYTRLGSIYHNMKTRCYNPNYDKYQYYGGKGIAVCDEWLSSYDVFEKWAIENGYDDTLTLDRIDVNGSYCPENCRWVTRKGQANNRTSNRLITYNGETKTIQQWADITGISNKTISQRIAAGWSIDKVMTTPIHTEFHNNPITFNGTTLSKAEWARRLGLSHNAIANRIDRGWSVEKALTTPASRI